MAAATGRGYRRNRRDFYQADGPGDEIRAGQARGQDRGRQSLSEKVRPNFMTPFNSERRSTNPLYRKPSRCRNSPSGFDHRPGDVRGLGRRQCLPGAAGRPDHRRDVSSGGDRHGDPARVQGLDARREYRSYRGSIGESVAAGAVFTIPAFVSAGGWTTFRSARRILEIHLAHVDGQRVGRIVRVAGTALDGGRSGSSLPRVAGSVRDP